MKIPILSKYMQFKKAQKQIIQYTQMFDYGRPKWGIQDDEAYIKEAYQSISWVYACVSQISGNVKSVNWLLYRKQKNGKLVEIENHPILNMINKQANPNMSSSDFFDMWASYLAINGKFYAVLNNDTIPTQLDFLYPHFTKPVPDEKGFVSKFEFLNDKQRFYDKNFVMWSKFFDPLDAYDGLSPIRAAAKTIDTESAAIDWNKTSLDNSAVLPGAFQVLSMPKQARDRLKEDWKENYTGKNNVRTPLILDSEKLTYTPFGIDPVDMDFIKQRTNNRLEICSVFGVPGQIVGDPEGQTYANYEQALKAFWENTIINKYLKNILGTLNREIAPRYSDDLIIKYDIDNIAALQENINEKADRIMSLYDFGILKLNEARNELNYDDDPEFGDMYKHEIDALSFKDEKEEEENNEGNQENNEDEDQKILNLKNKNVKKKLSLTNIQNL